MPPYSCPVCNSQVSSGADKCSSCGRKSKFCYQSFEIITTATRSWCPICHADYLEKVLGPTEKCTYCATRTVELLRES